MTRLLANAAFGLALMIIFSANIDHIPAQTQIFSGKCGKNTITVEKGLTPISARERSFNFHVRVNRKSVPIEYESEGADIFKTYFHTSFFFKCPDSMIALISFSGSDQNIGGNRFIIGRIEIPADGKKAVIASEILSKQQFLAIGE